MSEWFFLCSIALKRHACQGAVGPVPPPPSEDKLCQQQQYVKKTGKKVAKKRAKSATKVPSPPCYLCNKQFMGLRRIKEHYILVHFEAEFRVKYTQGKKLSSSEHAQCLFCPYGGNTRDLAFHVGIVHEKVRDYLPDNVWTDLFGHQGIKLNTSHDQESPVGGPTPPPEQQQQQQQPSKKTKKKKKRPASRMPGGQENIPACHLCNRGFTRLRLLKLHYIRAHYSAELRAKYMKGKQISQKISGQCELCPYAGSLLCHWRTWSSRSSRPCQGGQGKGSLQPGCQMGGQSQPATCAANVSLSCAASNSTTSWPTMPPNSRPITHKERRSPKRLRASVSSALMLALLGGWHFTWGLRMAC